MTDLAPVEYTSGDAHQTHAKGWPMLKSILIRLRPIVGSVLFIFASIFIERNYDSWMEQITSLEIWQPIPEGEWMVAVAAFAPFVTVPFAAGFALATFIFLIWDLIVAYRRAKEQDWPAAKSLSRKKIREDINLIKVHAPRAENEYSVKTSLGRLNNIKIEYHNYPKLLRLIDLFIDTAEGVYDGKWDIQKTIEEKKFRTLADGLVISLSLPVFMNPLGIIIFKQRLKRLLEATKDDDDEKT